MASLDVALIGCGRVAQMVHLPILATLPQVRLVAVAEPDPERREAARRRAPSALIAPDWQAVLDMPQVKAVVICTPHELHASAAIDAMDRGKHVYLEKPMATSLEQAGRVVAAWKRTGVVGMIGFNYRFHRLYRELKGRLRSNDLGERIGARSVLAAPEIALPAWKLSRRTGGGALLDMASHHFDLVRFLFDDEVSEVSAAVRSQRSEGDTAVVHVRLRSGLLVQFFLSIHTVDEDRFEVYTERARVGVDRYRSLAVEVATETGYRAGLRESWSRLKSLGQIPHLLERYRAPGREPSFGAALAAFAEAVREQRPTTPDFRDGYLSLAAVLAAEESASSGRVVFLKDVIESS